MNRILKTTVLAALLGGAAFVIGAADRSGTPQPETGAMKQQPSPADRTPAWIREHGNHLIDEPSLYLRQHAHNPVDWYPWGDEALARARAEDKLIFLSIGYSSCHWCHVMEHEVFEDDETAAFLNEHFVCIKVDREERPDLDSVYMNAVQMLTGRGGWPMSVFLTPDGKPFHGGTYYPREAFLQLVRRIEELKEQNRAGLEQQAAQVAGRVTAGPAGLLDAGTTPESASHRAWIEHALERAEQSYDAENGGLRQQQKFPTPVRWRFLLHEYRRGGDPALGERIAKTCEAISRGGLYDHVGGGFHRYTVDENWTVPHFEKMLYDNGQLATLLLEAGVALDRPDFTTRALDTLDFLLREMRDESGAFFASYDADSGGEEGSYYVWSREEIVALAGPQDGPLLADVLGVDETGNFEHSGKSVVTDRADAETLAAKYGRPVEEVRGLFAAYRDKLRKERDHRTPPGLDRKIVTSWNGLVIAALAKAYAVTGEQRFLDGAVTAADFLLEHHRTPDGRLVRASTGGETRGAGILDDYAFLASALLDLYQVTGTARYLATAADLVEITLDDFAREEGGFHLSSRHVASPLGRTVDFFDSVEPSGAAVTLDNLLVLSALTGRTELRERAAAELDKQGALLERAGLEMSAWLDVALKLEGPFYDVVIAGDAGREDTQALAFAMQSRLPAGAVFVRIPAAGAPDDLLALAPAVTGKTALDGRATAYVCEFGACQSPTDDPVKALEQLSRGWAH